jgi:alpha-beta hydrolase superfamily lysophospholipase
MVYSREEIKFQSSDGKNTVFGEINLPEVTPRAVIQISHGMIDHIGRYTPLVEYLLGRGFAVAGNDHLGHGKTAASEKDFGYFAKKDGYKLVVDDLKRMNDLLHERFKDIPVFLLGHSMGSFMARLYAEKYPDSIDGIIIHGTGGKNPLLPFGLALIRLTRLLRGDRHRPKLVTVIAFGPYNKRFDKSEGMTAWLTRDGSRVKDRETDPYTGFIFTAAGYADLFHALGRSNSKAHFKAYPKELPTLVISGDADPVGNYGKGVLSVNKSLGKAGVSDLSLKLYNGARHELFNETNREEVFGDITEWIEKRI